MLRHPQNLCTKKKMTLVFWLSHPPVRFIYLNIGGLSLKPPTYIYENDRNEKAHNTNDVFFPISIPEEK